MAVIELDLDAPPAPRPTRPPVHRLRGIGFALTAVLLLALGGAAPITPALWRSLGLVPLTTDDAQFELIGDQLYTIEYPEDLRRAVAAWSLEPIRSDWSRESQPVADNGVGNRVHLVPAEGLVLLQAESSTSIIDPGTGAELWTAAGWPSPLGAGRGLVSESRFRPGTEYDQDSGDPGELFLSSTGVPHTEPPLRTALHGVDMRTGERHWTYEAPGSVITAPIDNGAGVLVVATDKMTVLDRDTGKILRERPIVTQDTDGDVGWVEVTDDLVLLRRGPAESAGRIVGYGTDTLQRRWEVPDLPGDVFEGSCSGLPCQREGPDDPETFVLDPRTGRPAWRAGPDLQLSRRGDAVLEQQPMSSRPMALRDRATGAVRTDLAEWDSSAAVSEPGQPLVVSRIDAGRKSSFFGVVRAGAGEVQPLGYTGSIVFDCASTDRFVACRVPGGIQVWAYRA